MWEQKLAIYIPATRGCTEHSVSEKEMMLHRGSCMGYTDVIWIDLNPIVFVVLHRSDIRMNLPGLLLSFFDSWHFIDSLNITFISWN